MKVIETEKKTYVAHIYEDGNIEVEPTTSRNPKAVDVKDGALGFKYYDVIEAKVLDGDDVVPLTSVPSNESGIHYTIGRKMNRVEVIQEFPDKTDVIEKMEQIETIIDEPSHVVNVGENFYIFRPKDSMYHE